MLDVDLRGVRRILLDERHRVGERPHRRGVRFWILRLPPARRVRDDQRLASADWGTGGFKATPGSGWVFAHTIANDAPHPLNAAFSLERFATGHLIDEHGAAPAALAPLWIVSQTSRKTKQFVGLQNDVTAADIALAAREGYRSIEHVKRYTALGFGTDQGKLGNLNGMAILAQTLAQDIAATGTTTIRPNYTPVNSERSQAAMSARFSI